MDSVNNISNSSCRKWKTYFTTRAGYKSCLKLGNITTANFAMEEHVEIIIFLKDLCDVTSQKLWYLCIIQG